MAGWVVYHPKRIISEKNGIKIYHDKTSGNQDPYIWNERFLHTYCHMSQIKQPKKNDIIFWVSGDTFPNFNKLFCDLVFVVESKIYWKERNDINEDDDIIDSNEAFIDHYRWVEQHNYKRRKRYTLKANSEKSFQPQNKNMDLVSIEAEILQIYGGDIYGLRDKLVANIGSKPLKLEDSTACELYNEINIKSQIKLYGKELQCIRKENLDLASNIKNI